MHLQRPSLFLALFFLGFTIMAGCGGSRGLPEEPSITLMIPLEASLPALIPPAVVKAGTQTWSADWEAPWQHLHIHLEDLASGQSLPLYEKNVIGNTLRLRGPFQGKVLSLIASNLGAKRRTRAGMVYTGKDSYGSDVTLPAYSGEQTHSVLLGRVTGAVGSTLTGLPSLSAQNVLASKLYWSGKANSPAIQATYIQFNVTDGVSHPIRQVGDLLQKSIQDGDISRTTPPLVEDSLVIGADATMRLLFQQLAESDSGLTTLATVIDNESQEPITVSLNPLACNSSTVNSTGVDCTLTGSQFGSDVYSIEISLTAVRDPRNTLGATITDVSDSAIQFTLNSAQMTENEQFRLTVSRTASSGIKLAATHPELIQVTYDEGGN